MNSLQRLLVAAGSILLGPPATAQQTSAFPDLRQFSDGRIRHQKALSLTLGSYALANIAVGVVGAGQTAGETTHFHRMNVYWNLVNLGIAGAGLLGGRGAHADEMLGQAVRQHENIKQLLLINAGLDVAYVVGGAYLLERGKNRAVKADQLRGYGKAVMLQGGFLLAFDLVNYFIFKRRGDPQQRQLIEAAPMGIGVVLPIR